MSTSGRRRRSGSSLEGVAGGGARGKPADLHLKRRDECSQGRLRRRGCASRSATNRPAPVASDPIRATDRHGQPDPSRETARHRQPGDASGTAGATGSRGGGNSR